MKIRLKSKYSIEELPEEIDNLREMYTFKEYLEPAALRRNATPEELDRMLRGNAVVRDSVTGNIVGMPTDEQLTLLQKAQKAGQTRAYDPNTGAFIEVESVPKPQALSDYFKAVPTGAAPFNRTLMADYIGYMDHLTDSLANLQTVHHFLKGAIGMGRAEDAMPIGELWSQIKNKEGRSLLTSQGLETLITDHATAQNMPLNVDKIGEYAANWMVPKKALKVVQTYVDLMHPNSDTSNTLGMIFDGWTAAAKAGWTIPFPSFHMRNLETGLFQNLVADAPYSSGQLGKAYQLLMRFLGGKGKQDLPYLQEIIDNQLVASGHIFDIARFGHEAETARELSGLAEGGLGWVFGGFRSGQKRPWKFRGWPEEFGGLKNIEPPEGAINPFKLTREKQWGPFEAGERGYRLVETLNRVPPYIAAREAGYTPSQAKHLVDTIQYTYNKMTPFESKVVRRFVMPFYGWTKANLPYQFKTLFLNPIGPSPQTVRMMIALQELAPDYVPNWVRERLGMPLPGKTAEGNRKYIRSFGLPFEDLGDFVAPGQGSSVMTAMGRTSERGVARMHPAWGLAFRLYTGRDPYTGRSTKDLKGPTGIPSLDMLWQAGPLSRFRTEYYLKPQEIPKSPLLGTLNLFTGIKTGSYDAERWKAIELAKAIEQKVREYPEVRSFERLYVPREKQAEMSEELKRNIELLNVLMAARAQAAAKSRKAQSK